MAYSEHYTRLAESYDHLHSFRDQFGERLADILIKYGKLSSEHDFVDLGCGTGWATKIIQDTGLNFRTTTAVDPSDHLLQVAKANVTSANCVNLDALEFSKLPVKYDRIMISQCFHHFPEDSMTETLRNIRSQLRSDGLFIATFGDGHFFSPELAKGMKAKGGYTPVDFTESVRGCEAELRKCGFTLTAESPVARSFKVKVTREHYERMLRQRWVSALETVCDDDIEREVRLLGDVEFVEFEYRWNIIIAQK